MEGSLSRIQGVQVATTRKVDEAMDNTQMICEKRDFRISALSFSAHLQHKRDFQRDSGYLGSVAIRFVHVTTLSSGA